MIQDCHSHLHCFSKPSCLHGSKGRVWLQAALQSCCLRSHCWLRKSTAQAILSCTTSLLYRDIMRELSERAGMQITMHQKKCQAGLDGTSFGRHKCFETRRMVASKREMLLPCITSREIPGQRLGKCGLADLDQTPERWQTHFARRASCRCTQAAPVAACELDQSC